jgi:hypothetical protein
MDNIAVVRRVIDRILVEDLEPVLHLLSEDLRFKVAIPGEMPICFEDSGKQAVVDYFTALGGIVTFWQLEYFARGEHVIAVGRESFTIGNGGIPAGSEFALVCDVSDGLITRFLVVEDLPSFLEDGTRLIELGNRIKAKSSRRLCWGARVEAQAQVSA